MRVQKGESAHKRVDFRTLRPFPGKLATPMKIKNISADAHNQGDSEKWAGGQYWKKKEPSAVAYTGSQ
jgi:hypothetical protein